MHGGTDRITNSYVKGVQKFIRHAFTNLKTEKISCPCTHYINGKYKSLEDVELHLLKWVICQDYNKCTYNGEKHVPYLHKELLITNRVTEHQRVEVINDSPTHHPLTDLIDDAYGVHHE